MNQQDVWNKIASGWTHYRHSPFKEVIEFAEHLKREKEFSKQVKILDAGCGNCRHLLPFKDCTLHAIDFSKNMIQEAKKFCKAKAMHVKLKTGNITKLPYNNNFFDAVVCISVIHHLKPDEALKALKEIHRVLKPEGRCLISVWYKKSFGEKFIEWKTKQGTLQRFYRFYRKEQLETIIKKTGFRILETKISGLNQKNLFFIVRKNSKNSQAKDIETMATKITT